MVIDPFWIPKVSCRTLTTGARQLVVQDAFEMMLCLAASYSRIVDAEHERDVFILGRGRDDDLLDGAAQVLGGILGIGEKAGGFDDDLGADAGPIAVPPGSLVAKTLIVLPPTVIESASCVTVFVQRSEHGIVLQQVRQRLGIGQVVNRHEFDVVAVQTRTNDIPADPAEAINTYFDCHCFSCVEMRDRINI